MSFEVHSPHSVRIGIPFFRHESEGRHCLATWIAHSKIQLYLRILNEIELRAIKTHDDSAKKHISEKTVPAILKDRSKPGQLFCKIYQEGASQDTLATLENSLEKTLTNTQNIVIKAFNHLDRYAKRELRKKLIRKKIIDQAITTEDPDLKSLLQKTFKECYQFVVNKPHSSQSMPEIPAIHSLPTRRNSTRDRLNDEQAIFSPHPEESVCGPYANDGSSSDWEELYGDEETYIIPSKETEKVDLIQFTDSSGLRH